MEQKIISKTEDQCIYFMKDTNLDFYLIIPNSKQISIVLGLFPDVKESIIKTIPKEKDKAIVIPVINNQILTSANHLDTTSFKYIDSVLSYLINVSYKILTHNKLSVDSKILLNNHSSYENFNKQYLQKYPGRVELYNLFPKTVGFTNVNQNGEENFKQYSESTFKPVEPMFKQANAITSLDDIEDMAEPILDNESVTTNSNAKEGREPGFVSYVLLGVLVAVITLIFLYMML